MAGTVHHDAGSGCGWKGKEQADIRNFRSRKWRFTRLGAHYSHSPHPCKVSSLYTSRSYLFIVHCKGDDLLHSFVFPDSRAQLITLLSRAGLLPELNIELGTGWAASDVDFWSYAMEFGQNDRVGHNAKQGKEDGDGN